MSDPFLRRVAVHADGTTVDLALPATVSVAALIPSIVDLLGHTRQAAARYRLSRLGASALLESTTLAQNDIRDGSVLVLSHETPQPPSRRCDEDAEVVAATLSTTAEQTSRRANHLTGGGTAIGFTVLGALLLARNASGDAAAAAVSAGAGVAALAAGAIADRRLRMTIAGPALAIVATIFAAVAGLLIVPGTPEAPNVLLAAMAAAVAAMSALRVIHCGAVVLTSVVGCSGLIAVGALAAVVTGAPPQVVGSVTALACLGLLEVTPRASIRLAGLSPRLPAALGLDHPDVMTAENELSASAIRADNWMKSLSAAFAVVAVIGATLAALTAPRAIAFAAVTAVLLLFRARADHRRAPILAMSGIALTAMTFAIAATSTPRHAVWIAAATAILAAVAAYLGFVAPALSFSPIAHRGIEALGWLAMVAVVPLGCWTCGAFSAVRGLVLP